MRLWKRAIKPIIERLEIHERQTRFLKAYIVHILKRFKIGGGVVAPGVC